MRIRLLRLFAFLVYSTAFGQDDWHWYWGDSGPMRTYGPAEHVDRWAGPTAGTVAADLAPKEFLSWDAWGAVHERWSAVYGQNATNYAQCALKDTVPPEYNRMDRDDLVTMKRQTSILLPYFLDEARAHNGNWDQWFNEPIGSYKYWDCEIGEYVCETTTRQAGDWPFLSIESLAKAIPTFPHKKIVTTNYDVEVDLTPLDCIDNPVLTTTYETNYVSNFFVYTPLYRASATFDDQDLYERESTMTWDMCFWTEGEQTWSLPVNDYDPWSQWYAVTVSSINLGDDCRVEIDKWMKRSDPATGEVLEDSHDVSTEIIAPGEITHIELTVVNENIYEGFNERDYGWGTLREVLRLMKSRPLTYRWTNYVTTVVQDYGDKHYTHVKTANGWDSGIWSVSHDDVDITTGQDFAPHSHRDTINQSYTRSAPCWFFGGGYYYDRNYSWHEELYRDVEAGEPGFYPELVQELIHVPPVDWTHYGYSYCCGIACLGTCTVPCDQSRTETYLGPDGADYYLYKVGELGWTHINKSEDKTGSILQESKNQGGFSWDREPRGECDQDDDWEFCRPSVPGKVTKVETTAIRLAPMTSVCTPSTINLYGKWWKSKPIGAGYTDTWDGVDRFEEGVRTPRQGYPFVLPDNDPVDMSCTDSGSPKTIGTSYTWKGPALREYDGFSGINRFTTTDSATIENPATGFDEVSMAWAALGSYEFSTPGATIDLSGITKPELDTSLSQGFAFNASIDTLQEKSSSARSTTEIVSYYTSMVEPTCVNWNCGNGGEPRLCMDKVQSFYAADFRTRTLNKEEESVLMRAVDHSFGLDVFGVVSFDFVYK